jgi:SAM-dependent methyltransferase
VENSTGFGSRFGSPAEEVAYLKMIKEISGHQQRVYELLKLGLEEDDRVLDIGCGIWQSVRVFAGLGARSVGIDISGRTLASSPYGETRGRVSMANAYELPFGEGTFSKAMAVRALQWMDEPRRALAESFRVMKIGGGLVVAEVNWAAVEVGHEATDLTGRIVQGEHLGLPSPGLGPVIEELMVAAGYANVAAEVLIDELPNSLAVEAIRLADMVQLAVDRGEVGSENGAWWLESVRESGGVTRVPVVIAKGYKR